MANPNVTAGLRKASLLPQAIAANTPAITAKAHPAVITIQPDASPFDLFRSTQATTPSPRRIRISVPTNSPKKGVIIFFSIRVDSQFVRSTRKLCPCLESLPLHPAEGSRYRFLPFRIESFAGFAFHMALPHMIHAPLLAQFSQILIEADSKACGVARSECRR